MAAKPDVILMGPPKPLIVRGLEAICTVHKTADAKDRNALYAAHADVKALAVAVPVDRLTDAFMSRFPKLEIVSSFGVGYDHVDAKWAGAHGITVTNTPEVLTEEVADTALGLLLCTVRELPQAERYLRAGKWPEKGFHLTRATLRNRTVGIVGMGAIGQAIARRLDGFRVPVVYHTRTKRAELPYRHYANLLDMARDVDTLMVIVPGGAATANMINAQVLDALGDERHRHQHGARLGGRRAGSDPGAQGQAHHGGRPRRLRQGAAGAGRADGDGQCRAVSACRIGIGVHAR